MPQGLVLRCPHATWIKDPALGPGRFFLPPVRRHWRFTLRGNENINSKVDKQQKHYLSIERLQFPVSNADVVIDYGLQGQTVPGAVLDLKRPPLLSRDEHWLSLLVLLSRAETLENIAIYRLCKREHLEGGPPKFLLKEINRLRHIEQQTVSRLDERLRMLKLVKLRFQTTRRLLQARHEGSKSVPIAREKSRFGNKTESIAKKGHLAAGKRDMLTLSDSQRKRPCRDNADMSDRNLPLRQTIQRKRQSVPGNSSTDRVADTLTNLKKRKVMGKDSFSDSSVVPLPLLPLTRLLDLGKITPNHNYL